MSVYIVPRKNAKSPTTYHVRWSKGKYEPVVYLGMCDTKKRAEARKHKALDLLAIGIAPTLEMFKHTGDGEVVRLGKTIDRWLASNVQWAEGTRVNQVGYGKAILEHFGDVVPARIDVEAVQDWIRGMTEAKLRATTQKTRITALGGILKFAKHPSNPVRSEDLNRPKGKARRKPLPRVSEMAAIQVAMKGETERAIFQILEHTGMRVTEATKLSWGRVDTLGRRLVDVGYKKEDTRVIPVLPGQPDWLPVKPEGADPEGLVFGGMTSKTFASKLEHACVRAGTMHVNPHLMRHVHASRLLAGEQGGGIATTMGPADMANRMGHTVTEFLKTYSHAIPPA